MPSPSNMIFEQSIHNKKGICTQFKYPSGHRQSVALSTPPSPLENALQEIRLAVFQQADPIISYFSVSCLSQSSESRSGPHAVLYEVLNGLQKPTKHKPYVHAEGAKGNDKPNNNQTIARGNEVNRRKATLPVKSSLLGLQLCRQMRYSSCTWFSKYTYWHYDVATRSCVTHTGCGLADPERKYNFFWNEDECIELCKSPHIVTTENWGRPDFNHGLPGLLKQSFNKYSGKCEKYIDICPECPGPLTFDTVEECTKHCVADKSFS
ncbi:hypothetical protein RF11_08870 [Thelohanellus kitauei]|uniref:BPTI/Kunitz inhibitor domain-containing protein n=1 Tax=Thelohanellus kitauei TaxID=669202 RepID=A0A0C2JVX8_THEKT|nr:hypothetical protein RF11_08870 [Thelohanellus kitauei]